MGFKHQLTVHLAGLGFSTAGLGDARGSAGRGVAGSGAWPVATSPRLTDAVDGGGGGERICWAASAMSSASKTLLSSWAPPKDATLTGEPLRSGAGATDTASGVASGPRSATSGGGGAGAGGGALAAAAAAAAALAPFWACRLEQLVEQKRLAVRRTLDVSIVLPQSSHAADDTLPFVGVMAAVLLVAAVVAPPLVEEVVVVVVDAAGTVAHGGSTCNFFSTTPTATRNIKETNNKPKEKVTTKESNRAHILGQIE